MGKVGLTVCYDTKNFGSQLQVLATNEKVKEFGYDAEIIRYKKKMSYSLVMQSVPRLFNSYFISNKIRKRKKRNELKKYPEIQKDVGIRNKRFEKFVSEHFKNLSKVYNGWDELKKEANDKYDTFLCGSDQLWLPSNLGSHFYTLEFSNDDKKRIAYATSFGVSQIPWYQKKRTKKYLNRFDFLSSREIKGSEIIEELTGKKSQIVCDPTLLLTKIEWEKILPIEKVIEEKYIFCYFLGTNIEHRKIAQELKEKTGYKIVTIPFLDNFVEEDKSFGDYPLYDVDSKDFVNLIRNAEYILTDSFHGSVFSILNHKKFITLNRFSDNSKNSRNSRIDSLCTMLELSDRRYSGNIVEKIEKEIDYEKVDSLLEKVRSDSLKYLSDSLKGEKLYDRN